MNPIAIMQGRLSPAPAARAQAFPRDRWQREFDDAAMCGFDQLQWLITAESADTNPLFQSDGVSAINRAVTESGVHVTSLCADFLVSWPLLGSTENDQRRSLDLLMRTIEVSPAIGVQVIVVPTLEAAAIRTPHDEEVLSAMLAPAIAAAERRLMRLALETELPGDRLRAWLGRVDSPALAACYDVGNAAALGFDARADIIALGQWLAAVHIKDRRRSGPSVPLGQGDADLPRAFSALAEIGFAGPLVLETPVGDDPIAAALRHREFVAESLIASRPVRT